MSDTVLPNQKLKDDSPCYIFLDDNHYKKLLSILELEIKTVVTEYFTKSNADPNIKVKGDLTKIPPAFIAYFYSDIPSEEIGGRIGFDQFQKFEDGLAREQITTNPDTMKAIKTDLLGKLLPQLQFTHIKYKIESHPTMQNERDTTVKISFCNEGPVITKKGVRTQTYIEPAPNTYLLLRLRHHYSMMPKEDQSKIAEQYREHDDYEIGFHTCPGDVRKYSGIKR